MGMDLVAAKTEQQGSVLKTPSRPLKIQPAEKRADNFCYVCITPFTIKLIT